MKRRIGSAAVAYALNVARSDVGGFRGLCLRFTRLCFNIDAKYDSARSAWEHTPEGDRHELDPEPPPGVPVYWKIGQYWHVATSVGGGWVVSTDILRTGMADRVRISTITRGWGATYLGWAETLNGVRVWWPAEPGAAPKTVSYAHVVAAADADPRAAQGKGLHPADVRIVEAALVAEGLLDARWSDGAWGTKTTAAWRRFQKRRGDTTPTGRPGRVGLMWLGAKHGFVLGP